MPHRNSLRDGWNDNEVKTKEERKFGQQKASEWIANEVSIEINFAFALRIDFQPL